MKLTFIRPFLNGEAYEPPLGIGFLASYLRENIPGIELEVLDLDVLRWKKQQLIEALKKSKPDAVCVSAFSYNRFDGFEIAKLAKETGTHVIFGGQHTTYIDKETLEAFPYIDVIIRGEAEETLKELVIAWKSNKPIDNIKGISFMKGKTFTRTPDREFIEITDLPMPAYDIFATASYKHYGIMGSRGCPYNCNFCGSPQFWQRKMRFRNPKKVVDEIEHLLTTYGKKMIHFKDDVFTVSKSWTREVLEEVKRRNLQFEWECLTRVNLVDPEILQLMKETGCQTIEYGIETGSDELMRSINKASTKDLARKAVKMTKEAGIRAGTFFMVGHPGETEQSLEQTFDFAFELRGDTVTFTLTDAIPGTALYELAKQNGNLNGFSWSERKTNLSGYPVPRFQNANLPESKMLEYSKRFIMRLAFSRLFDMHDDRDYNYVLKNEYTPYHFSIKSMNDVKMFLQELNQGMRRSSSSAKRIKGMVLAPILLSKIASTHANKLYRKVIRKMALAQSHLYDVSETNIA